MSSLLFHAPGSGIAPVIVAQERASLGWSRQLWQLLLADAAPWPDARMADGASALQTRADAAISRFSLFREFVTAHPLIGRIPELPIFLDAVFDFLNERAAPYAGHELLLIAQQHPSRGESIDPLIARLHENWRHLSFMIEHGEHHMLDGFMGHDRRAQDITCGKVWVERDGFGLHTLEHPYFASLARLYVGGREHAPDAPRFDQAPPSRPVPGTLQAGTQADAAAPPASPAPPEPQPGDPTGATDATMGSDFIGSGKFVQEAGLWGYFARGRMVQPCMFDKADALYPNDYYLGRKGYRVWQQGRAGWMRGDGKLVVPCVWDDVLPTYATGLFTVKHDGHWGMVDRRKQQILPCDSLAPVAPIAFAPSMQAPFEPHGGADLAAYFRDVDVSTQLRASGAGSLYIAVEGPGGCGVVDDAGRVLVPSAYARVEIAHFKNHRDARWFKVTSRQGLHGLWSTGEQRELIACEHAWLTIVVHPALAAPLIVTHDTEHFRLWNHDGSALSPYPLRWFSTHLQHMQEPSADIESRFEHDSFTTAWVEGARIRTVALTPARPDGAVMLFSASEPLHSELESLDRQWCERGDRAAAFQLAQFAHTGFYAPADPVIARTWCARACGHEPAPPTASALSDACIPGAADLFVTMLDHGMGGPRDAPLARYWAGRTAMESGESHHQERYIRLLLDESAGPIEPKQALAIIGSMMPGPWDADRVAPQHARCLIEGLGVAPDWPAARELLYRSHPRNDRHGAAMMAQLLRIMAPDAPPAGSQAMLAEARYFQARSDCWPNRPGVRPTPRP